MDKDKTIETLEIALSELLILQAHYANLLNHYDDGDRIVFKGKDEWIKRLMELKKIDNESLGTPKTKNTKMRAISVTVNGESAILYGKSEWSIADLKNSFDIPSADEVYKIEKTVQQIDQANVKIKNGDEFISYPPAGVGG